MPKLVVLVVKDDTGKLWNYVSSEKELVRNQDSFRTSSLWVHKPEPSGDSSQIVRPTEPAEEEHVTVGVLLPNEETPAHSRIKEK